eukprot:jgi/Mesen1/4019/ME000211S03201
MGPFLLLIVVCVICAGVSSVAGVKIQGADRTALLVLRKGFQYQSALKSWDGLECNDLQGIQCTTSGHVSSLSVGNKTLGGTLAPAICSLTLLTSIDLSLNKLSGGIPNCLGDLPALTELQLSGNNFSGPLPTGLCRLKKLHFLDLGLNYLSGGISSCFGALPALNYLYLYKNSLGGPLPTDLCHLKACKELDLSSNQFSRGIPGCLGGLPALEVFYVGSNSLSGSLPTELCALKKLEKLDLSLNKLSGGIPNCLGDLPALTELDLSSNDFSGGIPGCLGGLSALEVFDVGSNSLSGSLPTELCALKKLEKLFADSNQLTGSIPSCLLALPALQELVLENNYFTGSVCPDSTSSNCLSGKCAKSQRSSKVCAAFCGATSAQGPCGGHGRCFLSGTQPTCDCEIGYRSAQVAGVASCSAPPPPPGGGANRTRGLVPPSLGKPPKYLSKYFRHASYGFSGGANSTNWGLQATVDWRQQSVLAGVKDQGSCGACWAFAAVGAIEAANAILISLPVAASEQQVLDCQRGGSSCAGGWPGDAFEYVAANTPSYGGLVSEGEYPYLGAKSKRGCDVDQAQQGQFGVAFWEQVDFYGWFGLLLAVQRQPVVVNIEADQDSFMQYTGQDVYSDASCFKNGVVDHSVLLVGYNLAAKNPYWIIRNSWGPAWGDGGYMYLAIVGGDGICGISSTPGSYPVVKGEDVSSCSK